HYVLEPKSLDVTPRKPKTKTAAEPEAQTAEKEQAPQAVDEQKPAVLQEKQPRHPREAKKRKAPAEVEERQVQMEPQGLEDLFDLTEEVPASSAPGETTEFSEGQLGESPTKPEASAEAAEASSGGHPEDWKLSSDARRVNSFEGAELWADTFEEEWRLVMRQTGKHKCFKGDQCMLSTDQGSVRCAEDGFFPFVLAKTTKIMFNGKLISIGDILKDTELAVGAIYGHEIRGNRLSRQKDETGE
ncbi:unnamed protein product, partial [Effrenium voratum]